MELRLRGLYGTIAPSGQAFRPRVSMGSLRGVFYWPVRAGDGGGRLSGTAFLVGFTRRKYAHSACKSASVAWEYAGYGMGGSITAPFGLWPVRIAFMKSAPVQVPSPVSGSGVRFLVKLTPHGPAHEVLVAVQKVGSGA